MTANLVFRFRALEASAWNPLLLPVYASLAAFWEALATTLAKAPSSSIGANLSALAASTSTSGREALSFFPVRRKPSPPNDSSNLRLGM